MLEYEWGANTASMIQLPGEDPPQPPPPPHDINALDPNRSYFHPAANHGHSFAANDGIAFDNAHHHPYSILYQSPHHLHPLYNSRVYNPSSFSQQAVSPSSNYFLVPKVEDQATDQFASRIGLNLGGRTYFSSTEDDFVNRLYRRSRSFLDHSNPSAVVNVPRCQAEGCNVDLTHAKHYHRRHKVCEFHSKAATVIAHGLTQRFCQQCSRFHLLAEFDNGKRSCRKRLADHNRRRRKSNATNKSPVPDAVRYSSSETPHNTGTHSPSSVTVALSPPRLVQSSASASGAGNSSSFFFGR